MVRERVLGMSGGTLQQLVAAAASLHRDRPAVTYGGGSLLYRDLDELSGELSHVLRRSCSAGRNAVIGLCCCDDLLIPVWILG